MWENTTLSHHRNRNIPFGSWETCAGGVYYSIIYAWECAKHIAGLVGSSLLVLPFYEDTVNIVAAEEEL